MRIAQIAPLVFRVPPVRFGGTERLVSYLTEELVAQGHEVTLFASGDSQTRARLVATSPEPIPLTATWQQRVARHMLMYERVYEQAEKFDVIHNHTHLYGASLARLSSTPTITTLHGALQPAGPWEARLFAEYREHPLVSISDAQRTAFPQQNWQATVYHGVPEHLYHFQEQPGRYLVFLGRVDPNKGLLDAIEIAKRAELPLKIAGYHGFVPQSYWHEVKMLFKHPLIEYVGELTDEEKGPFLGQALALLFPIQWEEPFGIVMVEALACGTPVIAYARGSVPEVITDGVTGWIVNTLEEAVCKVEQVALLDRAACRTSFERRFTVSRMAQSYLSLYARLREWKMALA